MVSKAGTFFLWLVVNSKNVGGRVGGEDAEWVGITLERGGMKNVEVWRVEEVEGVNDGRRNYEDNRWEYDKCGE